MAVGITSLDDWPMFTASLGWTGDLPPRTPGRAARWRCPAITSLVFMFVEVPLPVWKTSTTNWSSCLPSATAWAAWTIGAPSSGASRPRSMFTWAAAFLIRPMARMNARGNRSGLIWKFRRGALGLGAVVGVGRDLHLAHRVAFDPGRGQVDASRPGDDAPRCVSHRIRIRIVPADSIRTTDPARRIRRRSSRPRPAARRRTTRSADGDRPSRSAEPGSRWPDGGRRARLARRPPARAVSGRQRPVLEPDLVALDDHERAGGGLGPGPAVDVADAVDLGDQRQVGVAAGHVPEAPARGRTRRPAARSSWLFRCHRLVIRRIHRAARCGIHFWMK